MKPVQDDHLLLNNIINSLMHKKKHGATVELIIRPECNQQCKYCYLKQHGHESYPIRANKEQIINNVTSIMNYFIEQDYKIKRMDLFAGDMFYDNLFFDIIEPIKLYYTFLSERHPDFMEYHRNNLENGYINPAIIIPCNMSFCENDQKIEQVRQICQDFEKIGVKIFFSYSTDGKFAIDSREQKSIDDTFFDKVFKFCEEMDWGIHPMISYENIDVAIDNYEWFKTKMKQFKLNNGSTLPYYLEVRNDGWTNESLKKYQQFLIYHLNDLFHNYNKSDLHQFFNNYFREYQEINGKYTHMGNTEGLGKFVTSSENNIPCGLGIMDMTINVGTLSLVPCHRLAYPELNGGYFIQKNNKIIELQASEYLNAYLNIVFFNNILKPKCISCDYNQICMKGCAGSQYEVFADPYFSIPSVCSLFECKYSTLLDYYHSIGLFHHIFNVEPRYPVNTIFKELLLKHGYNEYKKYTTLGDFK